MPRIEAAAQIAVGDRLPGARGVDEAPAAGVDPDVVDAAPADAKKYQGPRGERRGTWYLQFLSMSTAVRSFAKINIGLAIGPLRDDNFHNLRTVYQTIALHDVLKV